MPVCGIFKANASWMPSGVVEIFFGGKSYLVHQLPITIYAVVFLLIFGWGQWPEYHGQTMD